MYEEDGPCIERVSKDVPEIIEYLGKETSLLLENLKRLNEILQPAMKQICEDGSENKSADRPMCELAAIIRDRKDQVYSANVIINNIIDRLQI